MRAAGVEPDRRTLMPRETKVSYDVRRELFYRDENGFLNPPKLSGYIAFATDTILVEVVMSHKRNSNNPFTIIAFRPLKPSTYNSEYIHSKATLISMVQKAANMGVPQILPPVLEYMSIDL